MLSHRVDEPRQIVPVGDERGNGPERKGKVQEQPDGGSHPLLDRLGFLTADGLFGNVAKLVPIWQHHVAKMARMLPFEPPEPACGMAMWQHGPEIWQHRFPALNTHAHFTGSLTNFSL